MVEGQVRDGWLLPFGLLRSVVSHMRLDYAHSVQQLEKSEGRWVLMDGKDLGLGLLLKQRLPCPSVKQVFAQAIELTFDQARIRR